jgi:hypothetical protein
MAAVVEEGLLDGDEEVEGKHTQEDVAVDAGLALMVDRAFGERRLRRLRIFGQRDKLKANRSKGA